MMKAGFGLCLAALALAGVTGCSSKNYVRKQTAPLIDHTNQLDEKTAANNRNLHDVDDRAQAGIKQAQGAADTATQNAQNATKAAGEITFTPDTTCCSSRVTVASNIVTHTGRSARRCAHSRAR